MIKFLHLKGNNARHAHSPTFPSLHLRHNSFCNPSVALSTSQLILHPFQCFTYVTFHFPTLLLLILRHRLFTYVRRPHSPTFASLHLHHNSFSNPIVALPTSQLILQPFCRFTYVTTHSPTLLLLHLCHTSFSNTSFASPTLQALHLIHLASRPWSCEMMSCLVHVMLNLSLQYLCKHFNSSY